MCVHLWCEARGSGREFCATCVYEEDEDDESNELHEDKRTPQKNQKRKPRHMKAKTVLILLLC